MVLSKCPSDATRNRACGAQTHKPWHSLSIMVITHRATGLAWGVGLISLSAPSPTIISDTAHVNEVARRQAHNHLGIWSDGHARHVTITWRLITKKRRVKMWSITLHTGASDATSQYDMATHNPRNQGLTFGQ